MTSAYETFEWDMTHDLDPSWSIIACAREACLRTFALEPEHHPSFLICCISAPCSARWDCWLVADSPPSPFSLPSFIFSEGLLHLPSQLIINPLVFTLVLPQYSRSILVWAVVCCCCLILILILILIDSTLFISDVHLRLSLTLFGHMLALACGRPCWWVHLLRRNRQREQSDVCLSSVRIP